MMANCHDIAARLIDCSRGSPARRRDAPSAASPVRNRACIPGYRRARSAKGNATATRDSGPDRSDGGRRHGRRRRARPHAPRMRLARASSSMRSVSLSPQSVLVLSSAQPLPSVLPSKSGTAPTASALLVSLARHSGARRSREPGIHNHQVIHNRLVRFIPHARGLWIPGSSLSLGPGMTPWAADVIHSVGTSVPGRNERAPP